MLNGEAAAGFPASDYDRVLVARLWRQAGETELAIESLQDIPPRSETIDLATYEAARILFEAGRDVQGSRAYWSACGASDERVRAEIAWDLLPVTIPEERDAWPDVPVGEPTCEWLRLFWVERAHRMVIPMDERLALHFRRTAEARDRYRVANPRLEADMASDHGRSSGLSVDDRGLLFIRMGAPEYEQACPEEIPAGDDLINRLGVCWVYARPPHYRIYYLTTKDRFGRTWPDGDYRIQESLSQQAEPGTLLFQKYVMNSDLTRSTKTGLIGRGPAFRVRRLVMFDKEFPSALGGLDSAMALLNPGDLDDAEYRRYERDMQLATRRYTSAALEQIPDAPALEATLDLQFEALRFLNPSEKRWQVWMLGTVPVGQLTASSPEKGDATFDVGGRYSVMRADSTEHQPTTSRSVPSAGLSPTAGLILRGATAAGPGSLPITFVVEDLNRPGTGIWVHDTINIPAIGGLPQLSDVALAQAAGGTWTRDGRTFLQVSPAHVTNPDGSLHTYFEVYGVRAGTRYEVEFRLASVEAAERIWRLRPDDLGFRLQFTSEMPGDIGRHHLRLDLSNTEPGAYVLAVRIQDEDSKAYSLPSVTEVSVTDPH